MFCQLAMTLDSVSGRFLVQIEGEAPGGTGGRRAAALVRERVNYRADPSAQL